MNPPRIAIVTYNWSPRNAIGTHRPYSWAKWWSEAGAEITVLTAKKYGFDEPLDLSLAPLEGVDIIEVPFISAVGAMPVRSLKHTGLWSILKQIRRLFTRHTGIPVDVRDRWIQAARPFAEHLATEVDVVVSTHGPPAAHLIAAEMKRSNSSLYWIADYRDLWSQNHLSEWSPSMRQREKEKELETVGRLADSVTTVSEELANDLGGFLGCEVSIVMNGFDISESELYSNLKKHTCWSINRPLRIVYTGMIYPGKRDPTPLFSVISSLKARSAISSGDILIKFYGLRQDGVSALVKKYGISDFVEMAGHVNRENALQAQRAADLLLLLEASSEEGKGVLTGKLFEYIASGTPVLSLGSTRDSAIARVLRQCGSGICVQEDSSVIENILLHLLHGEKPAWFQPVPEQILRYSRKFQSHQMYADQILKAAK